MGIAQRLSIGLCGSCPPSTDRLVHLWDQALRQCLLRPSLLPALQSGELKAQLQQALGPGGMVPPLQERLHTLLQSAPVLLFMKGSPDQPRCGYSRKVHPLSPCTAIQLAWPSPASRHQMGSRLGQAALQAMLMCTCAIRGCLLPAPSHAVVRRTSVSQCSWPPCPVYMVHVHFVVQVSLLIQEGPHQPPLVSSGRAFDCHLMTLGTWI
jgi:hypothetical protein